MAGPGSEGPWHRARQTDEVETGEWLDEGVMAPAGTKLGPGVEVREMTEDDYYRGVWIVLEFYHLPENKRAMIPVGPFDSKVEAGDYVHWITFVAADVRRPYKTAVMQLVPDPREAPNERPV